MKTAKKMNNVQRQPKIKLHQLTRKILARRLYSSLDPLQQKKKTLAADLAKQMAKSTVLKYGVINSKKNVYAKSRSTKTLRLYKNRKENQSVI